MVPEITPITPNDDVVPDSESCTLPEQFKASVCSDQQIDIENFYNSFLNHTFEYQIKNMDQHHSETQRQDGPTTIQSSPLPTMLI